jgi:hypothetical protein
VQNSVRVLFVELVRHRMRWELGEITGLHPDIVCERYQEEHNLIYRELGGLAKIRNYLY